MEIIWILSSDTQMYYYINIFHWILVYNWEII